MAVIQPISAHDLGQTMEYAMLMMTAHYGAFTPVLTPIVAREEKGAGSNVFNGGFLDMSPTPLTA